MGKRMLTLLMILQALVVCSALLLQAVTADAEVGYGYGYSYGHGHYKGSEGFDQWLQGIKGKTTRRNMFILQDSKHVIKTEAGEMKVVRGVGGKFINSPMHIGFITMEPRSLFIPQYLDSTLILFIRHGEARIGSIYKDDLVEQQLKAGDVYRIQSGSAFYIENTQESEQLHAICSIDTSESLHWQAFQSYFIGGGSNPASVLGGFDHQTMATAFNVSYEELGDFLSKQQSGAIVYLSHDSHPPSMWNRFLDLEHHERRAHLKRMVPAEEDEENKQPTWSFRKLWTSMFGKDVKRFSTKSLDSYNLYNRQADFKNNYGWSVAVDGFDYHPLRQSRMGIYLVNLTAGSMMAPHINPTATEYGIVLRGTGYIQIVYPNGTQAMNARVRAGDVFWIPRYFPFCQIASRSSSFEFFGFTTSAHKNRPQFLVGQNSLLQCMRGPEFATAFGVSEERLRELIDAQREGVILPALASAPRASGMMMPMPEEKGKPHLQFKPSSRKMKDAENFGFDMVMTGFD